MRSVALLNSVFVYVFELAFAFLIVGAVEAAFFVVALISESPLTEPPDVESFLITSTSLPTFVSRK